MSRSAISGLPLALALLAVPSLAGCTSTYGTGEAPEMALFREMTGGFLSKDEKAPIQYNPRAPLVTPPAVAQLPQPAPSGEAVAANWPQDPDQMSTTREYGDDEPRDDISQEEYRRLKPLAGLMPSGASQEREESATGATFQPAYDVVQSSQQQQAFASALAEAKGYTRTERRYLTDPPTTYRAPATTAPTEFEDIQDDGNFLTRWFTGRRR